MARAAPGRHEAGAHCIAGDARWTAVVKKMGGGAPQASNVLCDAHIRQFGANSSTHAPGRQQSAISGPTSLKEAIDWSAGIYALAPNRTSQPRSACAKPEQCPPPAADMPESGMEPHCRLQNESEAVAHTRGDVTRGACCRNCSGLMNKCATQPDPAVPIKSIRVRRRLVTSIGSCTPVNRLEHVHPFGRSP